ncbi:MAG: hypothetical protein AB7U45_15480 [Desulfamplus sp.]|jgi:hypothetical protein
MNKLQEYMMQDFVEKTTVAEAKKQLLSFTIDVLKDEGVISDESFNKWRNIKSGSIFDGVNSIFGCWQYGLQWNYLQIPIKQTVIKIKAHRI